jgi:hypothetical protein
MAQSRFINLTQYCSAEYKFEPLGSLNFITDDFIFVKNEATGGHQIFNSDASYHTTKNIQDLTVISTSANTYVYLDSEKIPNYLQYDSNLTQTILTGNAVVVDTVRFHFISGFDFDTFSALILSIQNRENSDVTNIFANILLSPETISELIIFNPKPLFLSNALYDRYIDIQVPSIKNINEDWKTSPTPTTTFSAKITKDSENIPRGFVYNEPITLSLIECGAKTTLYTNTSTNYDQYQASNVYTATVSQTNEFDGVGVSISESAIGDYLEFFLTYNSGFPEELISTLNRRNPSDDWIIIHQLSIFEQVGSAFLNTSKLVFFQENSYDEPNIVRPILKNANEAISMSIDYIARLTNRRNGEQIIREGSFNLISPKKYGRELMNIQLLEKPQSQRIYNKIIKNNFETTRLFIEPTPIGISQVVTPENLNSNVTEVVRTEYVPVFFNNGNISIANVNSLITTQNTSDEIVFGPGKWRFIISPFDNILKLKIFTETSLANVSNQLVPLDLNISSAKYRLVFDLDSGKVSIDNVNNSTLENLSTGQLTFNISKKDSETILASTKRTVYVTSVAQDGRETLIYSGEWRKSSEQLDIDLAISEAKATATSNIDTNKILTQIQDKLDTAAITDASSKITDADTNVKSTAVTPIVNRFGVPDAKSITATAKNTKL